MSAPNTAADKARLPPCARASTSVRPRARIRLQRPRHVDESPPEELDVEHVDSLGLLLSREQVEQQRPQRGSIEHVGDELVASAVPAATTSVGEHHDPGCRTGHGEVSGELDRSGPDLQFLVVLNGSASPAVARSRFVGSGGGRRPREQ